MQQKFEIWIEEGGQEQYRQFLAEGRFRLGRLQENEIYVPNRNISRHHLLLDISSDRITVTDLGSTNGVRMNGRPLAPHRPTIWPLHESLHIGPLTVQLRPVAGQVVEQPSAFSLQPSAFSLQPSTGLVAQPLVATIVSSQAIPQMTTLTGGAIFAGSDPNCAMRLVGTNVARHHCRLAWRNNQVEVTNLDANHPARLGSDPLPIGQPQVWGPGQPLQIGSATLYLTMNPAGAHVPIGRVGRRRRSIWHYVLAIPVLFGFGLVCVLSLLAAYGMQRGGCTRFDATCLAAVLGGDVSEPGATLQPDLATPTIAPTSPWPTVPPTATSPPQIIATYGAPAGVAAADCRDDSGEIRLGWVDLPFPYQGTEPVFGGSAEQFQLISRRSRYGGRINSFFDHEFPVYPPRFGGWEPAEMADSMVIFTGARVQDAYAQDVTDGYWYSGHAGIDFAPVNPREATTPVLAAADGLLYRARVDTDGNHMVWLIHDPDGDGFYQYATLYFHLHPDVHFDRMVSLLETEGQIPIRAGERIGTMGTTGRSTGIHLHFEVRHRNRNREFTRLDTIDPYGFFPSQEIPVSPWAQSVTWIDSQGNERQRNGGPIDYLWIHPLFTVEGGDGEDPCPPAQTEVQLFDFEVDVLLIGFAVVHPGFTFIARDDERNILDYSTTLFRRDVTVWPEDLDRACVIDVKDVTWRFLAPGPGQNWVSVEGARPPTMNPDGSYNFEIWTTQTGRYILVGRQGRDCEAPRTRIQLAGNLLEDNVYSEAVTVTLWAEDVGSPRPSGVAETSYSLDCGTTWITYSGQPFVVTLDTPHTCGQAGVGEQGLALGPNEFVLLASSRDRNNNIEEPPAQVRFTIE